MPHGLDHIVHAVRDLDAAAEFYSSAGFTVGARNRHSWGTHNRIVQLKNGYIEILEVAEPGKIVPHGARWFSFGAFNRDFLASRQGFSMLISTLATRPTMRARSRRPALAVMTCSISPAKAQSRTERR
jgi:Glyoxalase-like domain